MLNRLPQYAGTMPELLRDLGLKWSDAPHIAKAIGVSERTIYRWKKHGAPRMALLSLWWLSCHGHNAWDVEMHNRTMLALDTNRALWRDLSKLRSTRGAARLGQVRLPIDSAAANALTFEAQRPEHA